VCPNWFRSIPFRLVALPKSISRALLRARNYTREFPNCQNNSTMLCLPGPFPYPRTKEKKGGLDISYLDCLLLCFIWGNGVWYNSNSWIPWFWEIVWRAANKPPIRFYMFQLPAAALIPTKQLLESHLFTHPKHRKKYFGYETGLDTQDYYMYIPTTAIN